MASATKEGKRERLRDERRAREAERERAERLRRLRLRVGAVVGAAVLGLGVLFAVNSLGGSSGSDTTGATAAGAGQFKFAVGEPGPGAEAPPIELPSTDGSTWNLEDQRGERVLLYFQEGLMCQPCWDQITDLEAQGRGGLERLGIDQVVSVTTDPVDQLRQKVADEGIETAVLSDPDLSVSRAYTTNQYGMMGEGYNGHSFIVVGPDGTIEHRADYGGAPDYTMYVPVDNLLADIGEGLGSSS